MTNMTTQAPPHHLDQATRLPAREQLTATIEPGSDEPIVDSLLQEDQYLLCADFQSYLECQDTAERAYQDAEHWTRMSILNTARCGFFSSDRAVQQYCSEIWQVTAVSVDGGSNSPGQPADGEVELDIQVAGAVAPKAAQLVYFADNTDQGRRRAASSAV